jgi:integrase
MASLVKSSHSRYWIAAFRDATGRQYRQSTREINRHRAQSVADMLERIAQKKGDRQHMGRVFSQFWREHYPGAEAPGTVSVKTYVERYLGAHSAQVDPKTAARLRSTFAKFLASLGADLAMVEVTKAQIAAFRDAQAGKGLAGSTVNKELKIIKQLFRAARVDEVLWQDPAEGVKGLKDAREQAERRPFTLEEVRRILEVCDPEWRSLVALSLYTTQRLSDVALLCWNQVDFEKGEIRLTQRKTGKRVQPPIAAPLKDVLLTMAGDDPNGPVHPRAYAQVMKSSGASSVTQLSAEFAQILVAAGLRSKTDKALGRDISFHSLRYTGITLLKEAGVPDAVVMALAGHEAVRQSDHYTRIGRESLAKAVTAFPPL